MITSANPSVVLQALFQAQPEFPVIPKRGRNPHFSSTFARYEDMKNACDPILRKHGLSVVHVTAQTLDAKPALTALLVHESGEHFGDTTPLSMSKSDPQAQGSALTYLKRFSYSALLGLTTEEDDDAEEATRPVVKPVDLSALKVAAKRAGVTSEQVDEKSREKYRKPLSALSQVEVDEMTAVLVAKAELGAK